MVSLMAVAMYGRAADHPKCQVLFWPCNLQEVWVVKTMTRPVVDWTIGRYPTGCRQVQYFSTLTLIRSKVTMSDSD